MKANHIWIHASDVCSDCLIACGARGAHAVQDVVSSNAQGAVERCHGTIIVKQGEVAFGDNESVFLVARGGRCLIPVFALGRSQELLLILDEIAPDMLY